MKNHNHSLALLATLHAKLDEAKAREAAHLAKLEELVEAKLDTEYIRALYREATAFKNGVAYAYSEARLWLNGEAVAKHDADILDIDGEQPIDPEPTPKQQPIEPASVILHWSEFSFDEEVIMSIEHLRGFLGRQAIDPDHPGGYYKNKLTFVMPDGSRSLPIRIDVTKGMYTTAEIALRIKMLRRLDAGSALPGQRAL